MSLIENARKAAFDLIQDDTQLRKPENKTVRDYFLMNYRDSMSLIKVA